MQRIWLALAIVGVMRTMTAAVPPHPRLLANADDFAALNARLTETELGRFGRDQLLAAADGMLNARQPVYHKDRSGRRILLVSRAMINQIGKLALAYRLTGRRAYADKAIAQARAAAEFEDWNPSHFLDTAEMTFAEALCYDWLYDLLSESDRTLIARAIVNKGLLDEDGRVTNKPWWVKASTNWGQVCHGGLIAGAVATLEVNPDVARQIIDRALEYLPNSMSAFAPDGGFPEGPGGYWQYAMAYNIIAIWAIEKLDGTDHGLMARSGFAAEVDYLDACTGPTGTFFNFSDAGGAREPQRTITYAQSWLARRFHRPDTLVFHENKAIRTGMREAALQNRFFPLLLLCLQAPPADCKMSAPLARVIRGSNPIAVMRTSWTDPESWYAGLKGGCPAISHGHMDVGSFVLDAKGVRWVHDLGCENYSRVEAAKINLWNSRQDSPRWELYRYSLRGHSTLQFNAERQLVTTTAGFSPLQENPISYSTTLDLSPTYGRSVQRTFTLGKAGGFMVSDAISEAKPGDKVTWRINTFSEVRLNGNSVVLSDRNRRGESRQMKLTATPSDIVFTTVDHSQREHDYESDNPGLRELRFELTVPPSGALSFSVAFE